MKGRKAIPSKITELRGGTKHTHKKPRSDQEPKPAEKMPACPKHLDVEAQVEWHRAGGILQQVGLMTELDMAVLAGYCQSYSEWARATIEIPTKGPVWLGKDGIPRLNPWLRVAKEAFERMMKNAVLLGLSPSSRVNLKVENPKPKGKAELFMARKNGTKGG